MKPGMTVSQWFSATSASARISPASWASMSSMASRRAEVGRHLVVARARRVQPPGRLADQLLQPRLDVHVYVFERARAEPPFRDLGRDGIETRHDFVRILGRDHPAPASMRAWACEARMSCGASALSTSIEA